MPKPRISAKYTGENGEHYMGIMARDLTEDEFDALTDEQKATLGGSSFYTLRHDAPEETEKAARRVEKAPEPVPPMAVAALAEMPAPKDEGKK